MPECDKPKKDIIVINAGIPGNNTGDMLKRFEKSVVSQNPDLLIILAGTNDSLNSFNSLPVDESCNNYRSLLSRTRKCGAQLIFMNIPPACDKFVLTRHPESFFGNIRPSAKISRLNSFITELCRTENIPLADIHSALLAKAPDESEDSYFRNPANSGAEDGVHLVSAGYRVIAETVFKTIKENNISCSKIVCLGDSISFGLFMKGEGTASPDSETYPGYLARLLKSSQEGIAEQL